MGDSDDEWNQANNSSNGNLNNSSTGNNQALGNNNNSNSYNNKKNRDKFYRERDDSSSNTNNNSNSISNNNYNNNRRDWSGGDRGRSGSVNTSDAWKNRSMGSGLSNQSPHMSGYGGGGGSGGYQQNRMNSDYPRKYSGHQNNSGNFDSNSPPYKRKKEWESNDSSNRSSSVHDSYSSGYGHHGNNNYSNNHKSHHQSGSDFANKSQEPDYPTQPPFLSFKLFLQQQDDTISEEDAIRKYNDYKTDFKKTQINNFFLEHKEEDWFKQRYHPDENYKRRNEQNQCILNRLEVFMDLMSSSGGAWFENASAEMDHTKDLIKFLDAVVIKLEGGSDKDLKCLDGPPVSANNDDDIKEIKRKSPASENPDSEPKSEPKTDDDSNEADSKTNGNGNGDDSSSVKKRKSEDSGSESGAYTDSDEIDDESKSDHKKKKHKKSSNQPQTTKTDLHKTSSIFMRNLAPSVTKQDLEDLCKKYDGFKRVALSDPGPERGFFRRGWITFESHVDVKKICWSLQTAKIKDFNPGAIVNRELTNRIRSIPNLLSHHKSVIKNDIKLAMKIVQSMDKRWNLWQEKDLNDSESQAAMAESAVTAVDETQQTDTESKETASLEKEAFSKLESNGPKYIAHKFLGPNPMLNNITDYLVDEMNAEEEELLGGTESANPVSKSENHSNTGGSSFNIEIDRSYIKVLDKLILYLRVVHSIDFYNSTEYQQEDSMPNRCGIMFVRPALPVNAAAASLKCTQDEINQYTQQFEAKLKPFIDFKEKLEVDQAKKLGTKDRLEEVEKFIKTNTQELAPDRWLCPLSGKKFKGPEFIRKHLFYKHMDKITEVKKEVEYFNNYVFDPKRPQLPEHPSNKAGSATAHSGTSSSGPSHQHSAGYHGQSGGGGGGGYSSHNQNIMQGSPGLLSTPMMGGQNPYSMQNRSMSWQQQGFMSSNMMQGFGNAGAGFGNAYGSSMSMSGQYGGFKKPGFDNQLNRRGMGRDSREMIQYKDLDAPEDN